MPKPSVNVKPTRKGTNVITGCVRLAFQTLLEPKVSDISDDKTPKYSAVLLFEPNDPTLKLMKEAMKEAAEDFFGADKLKAGLKIRSPLRDGAEKAGDYPFYAGMIFTNTSTKNKPGVVDQGNRPMGKDREDEVYSGMWIRAEINCFGYDKKGNKGVSFGLNNVQKLGDDDHFGGRRPADQVFSAVVDDDAMQHPATESEDNDIFG